MIESILLTDSTQQAMDQAVDRLDGWRAERVPTAELARAVGSEPGIRAVLIDSTDPSVLREVVERAHASGVPVVVSCADDTIRRRAVELQVEEWY